MLKVKFQTLSSDGAFVGEVLEGEKKGKKVFAKFVAPGETVLVEPIKEEERYILGTPRELVGSASPERVEAKCKFFGRCGGCDLQFLSIQEQRRAKLEMVRGLFANRLKIAKPEQIQMYGGELPSYNYRNRVRLQVSKNNKIGFFYAGSHEVVEIDECPLVEVELERVLKWVATEEVFAEQLELSLTKDGSVHIVPIKGKFKPISKLPASVQLHGAKKAPSYELFSQVNTRANEALVDFVVKQIKGKQLTELYAGSGNFSFPLQRIGKRVVAVEASKELVDRASGKGVQFVCALAEKYGRQNKLVGSVLLDPPRGGAKSCVEGFGSDISEVVYVSCNPATLGRDLEILNRKGLKIEMVTLFDMFPQTAHVECVAVLRR